MAFLNQLIGVAAIFLRIYFYVLFFTIILSWTSLRSSKLYDLFASIADPYLNLFRGKLITGGWDFGPVIGMVLLEVVIYFLESVAF
jgi:uncharacterized protein YggT (Ycf19 family)